MKSLHGVIAGAVLLCATLVMAQSTVVTLQVTDIDAQTWNSGVWSVTLVAPHGTQPASFVILGTNTIVPNQQQSGTLNGTGGGTVTLTPNTSIAPANTVWQFSFCSLAQPAPCYQQSYTIVGTTQTITAQPPGIRISLLAQQFRITAYQDLELIGPSYGSQYYNLNNACLRLYNGSVWACLGSGGSGTPGTPLGSLQYNCSGSFCGTSILSTNGTDTINGVTNTFQMNSSVGVNLSALGGGAGTGRVELNTTSGTGAVQIGDGAGNELMLGMPTQQINLTNIHLTAGLLNTSGDTTYLYGSPLQVGVNPNDGSVNNVSVGFDITSTNITATDPTGSVWGSATGGAKGAGTINTQGLFVNGVAIGGSGTVNTCATVGANAYYAASGTAVSCDTTLLDTGSGGLTLANGTAAAPTVTFAANVTNGLYSNTASKDCFAFASTDATCFSGAVTQINDGGNFGWSQTSSASGTNGANFSVAGTGANEVISASTVVLIPQCKITSTGITLSTSATTLCSWSLPNFSKTWSWQCQGDYSITAGTTPNFTLGMTASQIPVAAIVGRAVIWSTVTGAVSASAGSTTDSGTTNTNILVGPTVTTETNAPWSSSGTIPASASAGTFVITGLMGGSTPAGTAYGTCQLY